MSILCLNEFGEARSFTSIEDLFNPLINTHYTPNGRELQWEKMLAFLNMFFSKNNIEDYEFCRRFLFNGSMISTEEWEIFKRLSTNVPDNQRYQLAMLRKDRKLDQENGRLCYINKFDYKDVGPNYASFEPGWSYFFPANDTPEMFVNALATMHTKWQEEIFNRCQRSTSWNVNNVSYGSPLLRTLLYFTTNQDVFISGGRTYNATTAAQRIVHEDAQLKITISNKEIELKIVQLVTKTNRRPLHQLLNYSTNALDILPYPNMEKKEKDPVLVGVELECCTDYTVKDLVDAAEDPFFLAKTDSSISGSKPNRMELVTAPSSIKYLKRQYALWFNKLDYTKFDVTNQTSNGMHVHIGRTHFEDDVHIRNFCWFMHNPANTDFLVHISERSHGDLQRWSPTYQFYANSRTAAFKETYKLVSNNHRGITNFKGGWKDAKTVEVRMFKGLVSYAAIVKNLEFVEAVFFFTKGLTSYRDLTLRGFLSWLDKQPRNKFILLRKFIDQISSLDRLLLAADIKDTIFNATDPNKVARLLMGASFKVTNDHITYLNKREKKRVYTLDKQTGVITVHLQNRAKLVDYDKSFAERYTRHLPAA